MPHATHTHTHIHTYTRTHLKCRVGSEGLGEEVRPKVPHARRADIQIFDTVCGCVWVWVGVCWGGAGLHFTSHTHTCTHTHTVVHTCSSAPAWPRRAWWCPPLCVCVRVGGWVCVCAAVWARYGHGTTPCLWCLPTCVSGHACACGIQIFHTAVLAQHGPWRVWCGVLLTWSGIT